MIYSQICKISTPNHPKGILYSFYSSSYKLFHSMRILLNHLIFGKVTLAWTISINVSLAGIGGFPSGSDSKESPCNVGDQSSISGSGWSPGEGNDNLLQYSCQENPMDREPWWATVHGVTESDATPPPPTIHKALKQVCFRWTVHFILVV